MEKSNENEKLQWFEPGERFRTDLFDLFDLLDDLFEIVRMHQNNLDSLWFNFRGFGINLRD